MIFYLHGFSSGANSHKSTIIKNFFAQYDVFVPEYPSHQPDNSVCYLEKYIRSNVREGSSEKILLMGSSLGGFYALYLANQFREVAGLVLINPCLQPLVTLAGQIGQQKNMVTNQIFDFTKDDYAALQKYEIPSERLFDPTLVLLDEGDEIIDYRYAAKLFNASCQGEGRVIVFPGGDHWFKHMDEALPEIEVFYTTLVKK